MGVRWEVEESEIGQEMTSRRLGYQGPRVKVSEKVGEGRVVEGSFRNLWWCLSLKLVKITKMTKIVSQG